MRIYSGKNVFSQCALLSGILYKPPIEKDTRPIEFDGFMILDSKCKEARNRARYLVK